MSTPTNTAPDMKMTQEEYAELRTAVALVHQNDAAMGRVLAMLLLHLGHSFGFDPAQEDKRIAREKRKADRIAEDQRLKDTADNLIQNRATEDGQAWTPVQAAALKSARAQEDQRIKDAADALTKRRAEEDALTKDDTAPKDSQPITAAPVKPPTSTSATTTTTNQTGAL